MTTVKFIHSGQSGAPVLSGQAGALAGLLDACLVNGFSSQTVDSLVVSGGVATVNRASGHPFEVGSIAQIAGAVTTGASVNGERRVLTSTSAAYTFDATGVPDQTATGTITHKVAPLGWETVYSGSNLRAYRSLDVAATDCPLRLDDTGTTNGRLVGYETMSDVNTGSGPFPTAAQVSGGYYWHKSSSADSTARAWVLCGDARAFYVLVAYGSGTGTLFFGDINSRKSPDPYACMLVGGEASQVGSAAPAGDVAYCVGTAGATMGGYIARGPSGLGSAAQTRRAAINPVTATNTNIRSGEVNGAHVAFPNPADNGLILASVGVIDTSWRGTMPGLYYSPQQIGASVFAQRESVTGVVGLTGRTLRALVNGQGPLFVDQTGPWR